jgi:hypothetical protein
VAVVLLSRLLIELGLKDNASGELDKSESRVDKWAKNLRQKGTMLTATVSAPVVGAFAMMINSASNLNESISAVGATFGESAGIIEASAKDAAQTVGMSQQQYLDSAKILGVYAQAAGLSGDEMAAFSQETLKAASDMASFHNADISDVLMAIQSGLAGEAEPLKRYGILLNDAAIQQQALKDGIWDGTGAMTEQQKVLARQNLIMDSLGPAAGDFAKTQGGLANQTRIAKAEIANLTAEMGQELLPLALKGIKYVRGFMVRIQKLNQTQRRWVLVAMAVAAALGPILIAVSAMLPAIALLVSPIGLIIAALVGLGIAYKTNFLGFADAVNFVGRVLWAVIKPIYEFSRAFIDAFRSGKSVKELVEQFPGPIRGVVRAFLLIADAIGDLVARWRSAGFMAMLELLPQKLGQIGQAFLLLRGEILKALGAILQGIWNWIASVDWINVLQTAGGLLLQGILLGADLAWQHVVRPFFENLPGWAFAAIGFVAEYLKAKGTDLIDGLWMGAQEWWHNVVGWFKRIKDYAFASVGVVTNSLKQKGIDLIVGLRRGAGERWESVRLFFVSLPDRAFGAVGGVVQTLWSKGVGLINGLKNGVTDAWNGIGVEGVGLRAWLAGIPGRALGAVPSMVGTLTQAGRDLMNGLWNGMKEIWGNITNWLGGLNPANYKGPPERDRRMLVNAGQLIMGGLGVGLAQGWHDVSRQLSSYSPSVAATVTTAAGSRLVGLAAGGASSAVYGDTHIHIDGYNRDPYELAQVVAAVINRDQKLAGGLPA